MKITLKMLGNLREYLPVKGQFSQCELDILDTATVDDLLKHVQLPENKPCFVMRAGKKLEASEFSTTALSEGDEVVLFPPIKGG